MNLNPIEKLRIRARSGVAEETLENYLSGKRQVRAVSAHRIEDAARAEGIALSSEPPPPHAA